MAVRVRKLSSSCKGNVDAVCDHDSLQSGLIVFAFVLVGAAGTLVYHKVAVTVSIGVGCVDITVAIVVREGQARINKRRRTTMNGRRGVGDIDAPTSFVLALGCICESEC